MKSIMWRVEWNCSQNCSFITAGEETWMFEWLQEEGWLLAQFISSRLGIPGHVCWPNTERFIVFLTPNIWEGISHTAHFKSNFHNTFPVHSEYQISPVSPSNWCCPHQPQISIPKRKSELSSWKWKLQFRCAGKSSGFGAIHYPVTF